MRREDKKKLTINRRIIVNHLIDLEGVLDYLISKQIFTPAIRERIVYESRVPSDRIRHMLDYLVTRNALAYQYFLESLILTGNVHIANILEPDYSGSEQCRRLIEREMLFHQLNLSRQQQQSRMATTTIENQNDHDLQYPTTCSQNHPSVVDFTLSSPTMNPVVPFTTPHMSVFFDPRHLHLPFYPYFSYHQLHQHHNQLNMRRLATFTASTTTPLYQSMSSRSNSSTGSATSQSMSPVISRARSSSVAAAIKTTSNVAGSANSGGGGAQITTSASVTSGLANFTAATSSMSSPASSVSTNLNNVGKEVLDSAPISPWSTYSAAATYELTWIDVNQLELDFIVHKTLPNLRKQLRPNECYQMERVPRGYCLIINNERFYDAYGVERSDLRRYGTDMDARRLRNLFEKLHFDVDVRADLKEAEMRETVASFASRCDADHDCLDAICLILLSHGTDGYVYGVDCENKINLDKDILNAFDEILIGKPKLFIFQACRGEYLNQKEHAQFTLGRSPELNRLVISHERSSSNSSPAKLNVPIQVSSQHTATVTAEEENIKRLKQLKLSSSSTSSSIQLMYKKKTASLSKEVAATAVFSSHLMPNREGMKNINGSSLSTSSATAGAAPVRSRSHSRSRGKYTAYIASAASAIRSAMIRTSPCSSCKTAVSISTQTSLENRRADEEATSSPQQQQKQPQSYSNAVPHTSCTSKSAVVQTRSPSLAAAQPNTSCGTLHNFIDARPIKTCLPSRSDFFIWYSSVRGFVSHRDLDGSPFIKCLATVFSRCAYELELIEMVRKVNSLMQQYEKRHFDESNAVASYFMVPVAEFHLTKRLYFNP